MAIRAEELKGARVEHGTDAREAGEQDDAADDRAEDRPEDIRREQEDRRPDRGEQRGSRQRQPGVRVAVGEPAPQRRRDELGRRLEGRDEADRVVVEAQVVVEDRQVRERGADGREVHDIREGQAAHHRTSAQQLVVDQPRRPEPDRQ